MSQWVDGNSVRQWVDGNSMCQWVDGSLDESVVECWKQWLNG